MDQSTRRRLITVGPAIIAAIVVLVVGIVLFTGEATSDRLVVTEPSVSVEGSDTAAMVDPDRPTPSVSDFYPESSNLSDCIGLVEKPGCGSESRGGWGQFAVFGALMIGLGVIIWRVVVGVRTNRPTT